MTKKKILPVVLTMLLSPFCISTQADIVQKRIIDYAGVQQMVEDIDNAEKTLLVLDFQDATLGVSCDYEKPTAENCAYLGSKPWFNWQLSLLESEPNSEFLVAKDKAELVEISNVFLETSIVEYTEESIPATLDAFAKDNIRIMFITQYGSLHRIAESKGISMPLNKEEKTSLADIMALKSPQLDEPLTTLRVCNSTEQAKVNYQNGVLYTAAEDKSKALKCFIEQYNAQLSDLAEAEKTDEPKDSKQEIKKVEEARKVVYVNDSFQESEDLYNAYRGNNDYDIFSLYYIKSDELWKPVLADGKEAELQKAAHKEWVEIKESVFKKVYFDGTEE